MAGISSRTRNGLLLIVLSVVVALSIVLAITLYNQKTSRVKRAGKLCLDLVCYGFA